MPAKKEDLPGTLQRSPRKVQRTYEKALDSAHEEYGSEERAHRTAWSAVKHVAEKRGDHWEPKDSKGPSDPQAAQSGRAARERPKRTHGGVDVAGHSKEELYERAKDLDVPGRSQMTKEELADAIASRQD
jgi:cation transport regulator ChaB